MDQTGRVILTRSGTSCNNSPITLFRVILRLFSDLKLCLIICVYDLQCLTLSDILFLLGNSAQPKIGGTNVRVRNSTSYWHRSHNWGRQFHCRCLAWGRRNFLYWRYRLDNFSGRQNYTVAFSSSLLRIENKITRGGRKPPFFIA